MKNDSKIDRAFKFIANLSIDKASQVLSKIVRAGSRIELEDVYFADITETTAKIMGEENNEVVGAFIDLQGDATFKFLFYVNAKDSLVLTDLILRKDIGTTQIFDIYAQSSVQEMGNIIASAISNVFASDFQIALKPTPPIIINDFASTIFQEYIMSMASDKNKILILESIFRIVKHEIDCKMFLLPAGNIDEILNYL